MRASGSKPPRGSGESRIFRRILFAVCELTTLASLSGVRHPRIATSLSWMSRVHLRCDPHAHNPCLLVTKRLVRPPGSGTDGREREDQKAFEGRSALFCLALTDVMMVIPLSLSRCVFPLCLLCCFPQPLEPPPPHTLTFKLSSGFYRYRATHSL
eukprot:3381813-Rhodomonas_salina.1